MKTWDSLINTKEKGKYGEETAVKYLESIGYKIIKRNFAFGKDAELDIVAKDGDVLVFIEIKSRKSKEFGHPIESVTPQKAKKIIHAAKGYMFINNIYNTECRFDIITIEYYYNPPKIEHYKAAFYDYFSK